MLSRTQSWIDRRHHVWGSLYLLLILLLTLAAMYTLSVSVWRGPWRDTWEAMPFIEKALEGQASWSDYWEQYGFSHRPLMSRWFWVADLRWFAGSNGLLIAVSFLMQCVTFFSVRAVLQRDNDFSVYQRCLVLAGVFFCLFNITQVFNFLHTFDVQWFLVAGFVVLSLERILANSENKNPVWLLVAWLCVFLASLNNFSALVMWPVEILLLIALRFPLVQIAGFSVATCLYLILYFYQLAPEAGVLPDTMLQLTFLQKLQAAIGLLVVFPVWYLSNPLSFQLASEGPLHAPWPVSWLAPSFLLLLLCCVFWYWLQGLLQRKRYTSLQWLGLSLMLYGYGVGLVTALGRAIFWDNVYALRYQNIVLLFWIGVVLWLAAAAQKKSVGILMGACLLLLFFGVRAGWYHDHMLLTGNRTRDAHLALVVGLENELTAIQATVSRSHLGKDSDYHLQHEAGFLRRLHTGPYADPQWQVPAFDGLQAVELCKVSVADFDVRGHEGSYSRLSLDFSQPANYGLIVWFDVDKSSPGLLIATRADTFWARLQQSLNGFADYVGFAKQLPQQKPDNVFAQQDDQWCRLVLP